MTPDLYQSCAKAKIAKQKRKNDKTRVKISVTEKLLTQFVECSLLELIQLDTPR